MTDKVSVRTDCTLKTSYRIEILNKINILIKTSEKSKRKFANQTNEQTKGCKPSVKTQKTPFPNAIGSGKEVKQKRAQGGCLGTKSR